MARLTRGPGFPGTNPVCPCPSIIIHRPPFALQSIRFGWQILWARYTGREGFLTSTESLGHRSGPLTLNPTPAGGAPFSVQQGEDVALVLCPGLMVGGVFLLLPWALVPRDMTKWKSEKLFHS